MCGIAPGLFRTVPKDEHHWQVPRCKPCLLSPPHATRHRLHCGRVVCWTTVMRTCEALPSLLDLLFMLTLCSVAARLLLRMPSTPIDDAELSGSQRGVRETNVDESAVPLPASHLHAARKLSACCPLTACDAMRPFPLLPFHHTTPTLSQDGCKEVIMPVAQVGSRGWSDWLHV